MAYRSSLILSALFATFSIVASTAFAGEETPQAATVSDMKIFEPYIGKFESLPQMFDDGKTQYHYEIDYHWFDAEKSIVKFQVSTVIPSQQRTIVNAEGFYAFDPFANRLFVFGAFTRGMTGKGWIGRFDLATGVRENWVKTMGADGVVTYVHDAFEQVDENSWKNKTSIRHGEDGDWTVVYEDTFTRIGA